MAVTSSRVKVRGHYEPLIPSVYHAPFPYLFRSPYKGAPEDADLYYFAELEALFDQMVMPDDVAGILIETIVGEGGYLVPTKRWLQMVRELCDRHGIMLILDEVQSGMGRTGKMWAYEHFDVVPDIMTAAKGLASGMPVAAVVSDRALMDKWAPGSHGGTYGGNAVGTAAAAATLEVMRDEDLPGNAARMGEILMQGLREIQADYPVIGDVRGLGPDGRDRVRQSRRLPEPRGGQAGRRQRLRGEDAADHLWHLRSGDPHRAAAGGQRGADSGLPRRLPAGGSVGFVA